MDFSHVPFRQEFSDPVDEVHVKNAHDYSARGRIKPSKTEMFTVIQDDFGKEFSQYVDFIAGKLGMSGATYRVWRRNILYYLRNPYSFESDLTMLNNFEGELSPTDLAWIENTRQLINKHHPIVIQKIFVGEEIYHPVATEQEKLKSRVIPVKEKVC